MSAPFQPATRNPEMIPGVDHGSTTPLNGAKNPIEMEIYKITAAITGTVIKGMNIIGFKTTGNPNITGSLMLNKVGNIEILPIALYCCDFANSNEQITIPKVIPDPVKIIYESKNCCVTIFAPWSKANLPCVAKV